MWEWKHERRQIQIRDTSNWNVVRAWDCDDIVQWIAISPDHKWLAAGDGKSVSVWDFITGKLRRKLPFSASTIVWSPDGTQISSGNGRAVWSVETGSRMFGLEFAGRGIWGLIGTAAMRTFTGDVSMSERTQSALLTPTEMPAVRSFHVFSPDGTSLVASDGHILYIVDAKTGEILTSFEGYPRRLYERHLTIKHSSVTATAFAPNGCVVSGGHADAARTRTVQIKLWAP